MTDDLGNQPREESIDSAALAGATIAAVLAVVIPKGPFDVMSIPIGLTLVMIILAYEGRRPRRRVARRLAFAASTGFSLVLVIGPMIELWLHHGDIRLFLEGGQESEGLVKPWMNAAAWFALGSSVFFLDRRWQRRWR